jgi:hypothetical protein
VTFMRRSGGDCFSRKFVHVKAKPYGRALCKVARP